MFRKMEGDLSCIIMPQVLSSSRYCWVQALESVSVKKEVMSLERTAPLSVSSEYIFIQYPNRQ
jgi:hypothetical protein